MSKKFSSYLPHIIASLFLAGFVAYAWTEPSQPPPDGNAPAPINVGTTTQIKAGALGIGGVLQAFSDLIVDGNIGIGTQTPGAKLDVQGGDIKVGATDIKGDGTISTNLNADKLDNFHASELRPPTGLYGVCTYEYPIGPNNCVRIAGFLPPALKQGPLTYCLAPGGVGDTYQYGTAYCACPAGYTVVRVPNVYGSGLSHLTATVYTTFCYKN